ncbi:MAG: hypothetical protein WHS64_03075 [Fervidobacterium sp.]|uniref:hypothetical protein n=1 Tax=Fervidobacterium TaxID=2422 RepID=UPI00309A3392
MGQTPQPYRSQLVPGLIKTLEKSRKAGALGVALSGNGSTMIALTSSPQSLAQSMQEITGENTKTIITRP